MYKIVSLGFAIYFIFLALAPLNSVIPSAYADVFPDVAEEDWFAPYVQDLTESGIMEGYPDGRFGSWDVVNRAELSKIVSNLKTLLQRDWLEDNIVEIALVITTVLGWIYIVSAMNKLAVKAANADSRARRESPSSNIEDSKDPKVRQAKEAISDVIPDTITWDEDDSKKRTNWWM